MHEVRHGHEVPHIETNRFLNGVRVGRELGAFEHDGSNVWIFLHHLGRERNQFLFHLRCFVHSFIKLVAEGLLCGFTVGLGLTQSFLKLQDLSK